MKTVACIAGLAIAIITALIISLLLFENPAEQSFQQIIRDLLADEKLKSDSVLLVHYRELKDIRQKMDEAKELSYHIQVKTRGPVPAHSDLERQELKLKSKALKELQGDIRESLHNFRETFLNQSP